MIGNCWARPSLSPAELAPVAAVAGDDAAAVVAAVGIAVEPAAAEARSIAAAVELAE